MKDRIEVRFTVATGKVNGSALKPLIKLATPYLERVAEAVTKLVESESDKEVRQNDKY